MKRGGRLLAAAVLAFGLSAAAQEDDWSSPGFPDRASDAPPEEREPIELPPPPLVPDARDGAFAGDPEETDVYGEEEEFTPPPPPPPLDSFTLFGARALGRGRNAIGVFAGFPYVGVRYARGFWERVDLGVSALTYYGMMTEARLDARWEPLRAGNWSVSLVGAAGGAFFLRSALTEAAGGARFITGRRHVNGELGIAASFVPTDGRGLHPFVDVRYSLAVDLAPIQIEPLGGVPPDFSVAGNTLIRLGGELPLSSRAALVGAVGLDLHGRREDAVFLFNFSFGVQTSF